jgi:ubiquinone/menaquinone biosynthesis C-methylase UbiE
MMRPAMAVRDRIVPLIHDLVGVPMETKPFLRETRRRLLAAADGRVLEVGAGTGYNLPYYPDGISDLTITDGMNGMLRRAEKRAAKAGRHVTVTTAPAESLPYDDGTFDTVVGSLLLCSVADQDPALAEIRRVLKPGGQYLFLEHVRSSDPNVARSQDRWERAWRVFAQGCHPNRDTLPRIESAFTIDELDQGEVPFGPRIVRPYVLGRGVRSDP